MASTPQSFENHTRYHPPFHFVVIPIFALNLIYSTVQLIRFPEMDRVASFAVAIALVVLAFIARINALRVQDRLIRLEERLRYRELLPPEIAERACSLSHGQIIALRFASDEELTEIARQVIEGRFAKNKEIKRAIKQWRPDTLRV